MTLIFSQLQGIFSHLQGACGHHANACQRSYAWWWKPGLITLVYLHCCDYLLFRVCFRSIVNVCWWEEAQPKNLNVNLFIYFFTVATICFACIRTFLSFSPKPCRRQYFDFLNYFAETMSPMYLGYFVTSTSPIHLFILMTILAMEIIQENFYYSWGASLFSLFHI